MKRKTIQAVVDYIARNHKCTFPNAWDTGEGIQAPGRFASPTKPMSPDVSARRDALVEEIHAALHKETKTTIGDGMNVRELRKTLKDMPPDARVHVEVYEQGFERLTKSNYGHAICVSRSEPRVVVISNRHRVLPVDRCR